MNSGQQRWPLAIIAAISVIVLLTDVPSVFAASVRICGTVPTTPPFADQVCGGVSADSNQGACDPSEFCCNETSPAGCAASIDMLPASCAAAGSACKMPGRVRVCEQTRDDACLDFAHGGRHDQYCCAKGPSGIPVFSHNIVNLTIFNGDNCTHPEVDFCQIEGIQPSPMPTATPTPAPTPTTIVPTPTATATGTGPTPTSSATPSPTATPTPAPGSHQVTFINDCTQPVWIAAVFGSPAQPFLINGGPPPWGPGGSLTWKIEGTNVCCTDATGASCDPDPNAEGCKLDSDCGSAFPVCAKGKGANTQSLSVPFGFTSGIFTPRTGCKVGGANTLICQTGDCAENLNCGTNQKGADNATAFELTTDTLSGDFYDVTLVAGFNLIAKIEPSVTTCEKVGGCSALPQCPWTKVVRINGQDSRFTIPTGNQIGACLAADKMVGNSAFANIMMLNPFRDVIPDSIDDFKIRCGCPGGFSCGDKRCATGFGCSPFTTDKNTHTACLSSFGEGDPCQASDCATTTVDGTPYSKLQICDPYGQCDAALGRSGRWPLFTTNTGTADARNYFENIKAACGKWPERQAPYGWPFDDPKVKGAAGGLGQCGQTGTRNYTVMLECN